MSASRDALIDVLTQHVMDPESGDCWGHDNPCGWTWTTDGPIDQHARHQADALAAAGIHPFRVLDPVEQP